MVLMMIGVILMTVGFYRLSRDYERIFTLIFFDSLILIIGSSAVSLGITECLPAYVLISDPLTVMGIILIVELMASLLIWACLPAIECMLDRFYRRLPVLNWTPDATEYSDDSETVVDSKSDNSINEDLDANGVDKETLMDAEKLAFNAYSSGD